MRYKTYSDKQLKQLKKHCDSQITCLQYAMKCMKRFRLRKNFLMKHEKLLTFNFMKNESRSKMFLNKNLKILLWPSLKKINY